jgi:hypothetical protein
MIAIAAALIGARRPENRSRGVEAKAGHYREQAQRCRDLAKGATDFGIRQTLLDAALEYDKLAERADKKRE